MSTKILPITTLYYIVRGPLLATMILAGCTSVFETAVRDSQDVDALRRLIRENPRDPLVPEARNRIVELEARAALRTNTRFAYNAFLERHGESKWALEVRRRLEQLDFSQAKERASIEGLSRFLRRHPAGRHSDQARRLREQMLCERWREKRDPAALEAFLKAHPELTCRDELAGRLKELRLERALASGDLRRLIDFVEDYPRDPLSPKARRVLIEQQVSELISAALFQRARQIVLKRADSAGLDPLLRRIERAERAWALAAFDPLPIRGTSQPSPALMQRLAARRSHPRFFEPLARATTRLRREGQTGPFVMERLEDPRDRWLLASRLASTADEKTVDALFSMLGDSFLEVRRRSYEALRLGLSRLGPARRQIWLGEQRNRLEKKARSGVLLLRLAVLAEMENEPRRCLPLLIKLADESESSDLFGLYLAAKTARSLELPLEAASLAQRFSVEAQGFAQQRTEAWAGENGLRNSGQGWLSLRQVYGLIGLWRDVLGPFSITSTAPARLNEQQSVLGPWLEAAQMSLKELELWLRDEEARWVRTHPNYLPCGASPGGQVAQATPARQAVADLLLLAAAGRSTAGPTLRWAACCHARQLIRLTAANLSLGVAMIRVNTPYSFVLDQ